MKNLFEVVKDNKKAIIRGALLVGGTIATALLANATLLKTEEDDNIIEGNFEPEETIEVEYEVSEE